MKRTVRDNIHTAYSLHDANVTDFAAMDHTLVLHTQSGMTKVSPSPQQTNGHVEFHAVQWDFSYAYLLAFSGNTGKFTGEKLFLRDFIVRYKSFPFSIVDETYGYNKTKYSGYLLINRQFRECMIEIYHEGDMVFLTEE
ncbi:MAG: hypothetical protein IKL84_01865 [Clostridia bacterium]|nr:hypothetical protein [Clostridia bacterium]